MFNKYVPLITALAIIFAMQSASHNSSSNFCRDDTVVTSWAVDNPPAMIVGSGIVNARGASFVTLLFENLKPVPIQAMALIVDYSDQNGNVIDSIPMLEGTAAGETGLQVPFPVERVANAWAANVPAGGIEHLHGIKNGISTGVCPSRARVTFAALQREGGTIESYPSADWKLGPTPHVIPWLDPVPVTVSQPLSVSATVKIDASGHVISVIPTQKTYSKTVITWLTDQMQRKWQFNPALSVGHPVGSELQVLFYIHKEAGALPSGTQSSQPVIVIDLQPTLQLPSRTLVTYGGSVSGTVVE